MDGTLYRHVYINGEKTERKKIRFDDELLPDTVALFARSYRSDIGFRKVCACLLALITNRLVHCLDRKSSPRFNIKVPNST